MTPLNTTFEYIAGIPNNKSKYSRKDKTFVIFGASDVQIWWFPDCMAGIQNCPGLSFNLYLLNLKYLKRKLILVHGSYALSVTCQWFCE